MSMATYVETEILKKTHTKNTTIKQNTTMPERSIRLDRQVLPEYEFTMRDEVILNLLDFIECPILKEFSEDMIIFNQQCYDYERWSRWLDVQNTVNDDKRKSGYGDSMYDQLLDPISGQDVGYRNSMRNDYFGIEIPRSKLTDIITTRNPFLLPDEADEFIPEGRSFRVGDFIRHVKLIAQPREAIRNLYMEAMKNKSRGVEPDEEEEKVAAEPGRNSAQPSPSASPTNPASGTASTSNDGLSTPILPVDPAPINPSTNNNEDSSDEDNDNDSSNNSPIGGATRRFPTTFIDDDDSDEDEVVEAVSVAGENTNPAVTSLAGRSATTAINLLTQVPASTNTATTTTTTTTTQPSVAENSDAILARGIATIDGPARKLPPIPSFVNTNDGEIICLGILQLAKLEGYERTLLYGKRTKWFADMIPKWIIPGGIMYGYSKPHRKTLSQKFRAAEKRQKS